MTTAADQFDDTLSPTDLQFGYLANSLAQLLETARREFERDSEAAKASLVTASHILQAEIERCSGANGSTRGGLAAWQVVRVRAYVDSNLHRTIHIRDQCGRASEPGALLSAIQAGCWPNPTCLRGGKASGESLPPDDDQCGTTERNSLERRLFGSSTAMQAVQTGLWPKSGQLEARP